MNPIRRTRRTTSLASVFLANGTASPLAESTPRVKRRVVRVRPMTADQRDAARAWVASALTTAPHRVGVVSVHDAWQAHAAALGISPGPRSEFVRLILSVHPAARMVRARDGYHLEGLALR